jgi:hypothetical protein
VHTLAWRVPLHGALDEIALREAFNAIITRHEALRTRFAEDAKGPIAVVEDSVELPFAIDDLQHIPVAQQKAETARRCTDDINSGFALDRAPLIRARLMHLGRNQHELLVVVHHIVFDGVSFDVLLEELTRLYSAQVHGDAMQLAILGARYSDKVEDEREMLTGLGRNALATFWRERLIGAPPVVLPPPDRSPATAQELDVVRSWGTRTYTRPIPTSVLIAVREYARRERTTPYSVYLAVLNVLLHRLTGLTDIMIGTPMSARHRSAFEPLIGYFVNVLVTRTSICDHSFTQLVRNVRESVFDALDHQRLPFETVVDEVRPDRTANYGPLFQVLFSLVDPIRLPDRGFAGLDLGPIEQLYNGRSPYALTVSVIDRKADHADLELSYAFALYDDTTAERMSDQFIKLLSAAMSAPDVPLHELASLLPVSTPRVQLSSLAPVAPKLPASPDGGEAVIRVVQSVWAMYLYTDVTEPDVDFVSLGGHSLAAARIAVELQELFGLPTGKNGVGISELTLFRAPTPRLLAAHLAVALGGWTAATGEAEFVLRLLAMTDEQAEEELNGHLSEKSQ